MEENTGHPETQAGETQQPQEPSTLGAPMEGDASSAFDGSTQETSNNEFSFEDVVFGDNQTGTKDMPQDTHENSVTPEQPEPVQEEQQNQTQSDNDQVRYNYWQSEAQKAQNELKNLQQQWGPTINYISQNPQAVMGNMQTAHSGVPATEDPAQETEEFPEPPERPTKPRGFSRTDALEDPQSDSARYMDDLDEWRDSMDEYNNLRSDYNAAVVTERMEAMEAEKQKQVEAARRAQANHKQQLEINAHVKTTYNMSDVEAQEFIQWGNRPENLSMDNLVQLYRLQKGQGVAEQAQVKPPSENFNQVQRAQQVPSPMGVLSGQTSAPPAPKNPADSLMDGLIGHTHKNDIF